MIVSALFTEKQPPLLQVILTTAQVEKLPFPPFQMKVESNLEHSTIKIHQKASMPALFRLVYRSQAQFTNDIIQS